MSDAPNNALKGGSAAVAEPPPSPIRRVAAIQYLRAFAALAVVVYHVMEATPGKFTVGSAGVDVFFVISGYIMWTVGAAKPQKPLDFWIRRIARVAPPYWLVTLITAALGLLKPKMFWMVLNSPLALLKSLAFIPYANPHGTLEPIVLQGWTLNYEMFFYLVFTLLLFTPLKRRLAITTGAFLALAAAHGATTGAGPVVRSYTDPVMLEFLAGAWIGEAQRRGWLAGAGVGGALGLFSLAVFAGAQVMGYQVNDWRPLLWGGPSAGLVYAVLSIEAAGRMPIWRRLIFLGDSSYSLYLTHVLVLAACASPLIRFGFFVYAALSVLAAVGVSVIFYMVVERPTHIFLTNRLNARAHQTLRLRST